MAVLGRNHPRSKKMQEVYSQQGADCAGVVVMGGGGECANHGEGMPSASRPGCRWDLAVSLKGEQFCPPPPAPATLTVGNIWRHFWSSQLAGKRCFRPLEHNNQGCS